MTYVDHDHITTKYFAQKTCHYKTVGKLSHYCFNNEVHLRKFRISFPKETCLLVKCLDKLQSQVVLKESF